MPDFPRDNFIFLETNRFDKDNQHSYLFLNPLKIIFCYRLEEIEDVFGQLEDFISKGYYAAGFVSYEAGYGFEDVLKNNIKSADFPLLWFGIYKKPVIFKHDKKLDILRKRDKGYSIANLRANISKREYISNINEIKEFIRQGDTYQVNYTFKYKFDFNGSMHNFYNDLKEKQSVSYASLIKTPEFSIISFSPELFFRKKQDFIEVRPMKGTIERGRTLEEDIENIKRLKKSIKNRSENVMIVDLLRNDLGRIAYSGTVRTEKLFEIEKYETLFQMVSIISSRLKKDIRPYDLFKAIFPSGSVTGAPKIRTMEIIRSLEKEQRRIYTGSIGFFSPDKEAIFNVGIRTILINTRTKTAELGIGSGIVYDSNPADEFEECKLKANFITQEKKCFELIETMLWQPGKGYFLLKGHLKRLLSSAEYFNFKRDKRYIIEGLKKIERKFNKASFYKVRLLLDKNGGLKLSYAEIKEDNGLKKIRFSDKRVDSKDIFLFHKTTNRSLYDKEYKRWREKGYFDVVFLNEKNQLTEGCISNIVIKKGRYYYTSPVESGLLDGIYRGYLIKNKKLRIRILYKKDIKTADAVYMINSVRRMVRVEFSHN